MFSRNDIDNLAADLNFIRDNMEKVVRLSRELSREIASPAEARAILGLTGGPNCPIH